MRIGFFTSVPGWGGSEVYLRDLILRVRGRGHAPVLFGVSGTWLWDEMGKADVPRVAWQAAGDTAGRGRQTADPEEGRGLAASSRRVRGSGRAASLRTAILRSVPPWVKLPAGCLRETAHLRRLFRGCPVDVMHVAVHGYEVAGVACRLAGIPCLAMNMITPPAEPYWVRRRLVRWTMRAYHHVSSQSPSCTDAWIRRAGLDRARTSFVWNGVDLKRFRRAREPGRRGPTDPFRVLSAGRLHPMKGFDCLIEAIARLRDENVILEILGEGQERGTLEARIAELGLGGRVFLRGQVDGVEALMPAADCFALASVSHESCPAVLAQAMACGLPLVTSDFGPLPEVNLHGVTGLVSPARDSAGLAESIRRLSRDPGLCDRMAEAGVRRAAEHFSLDRMVSRTLGLYARTIAEAGVDAGSCGLFARRHGAKDPRTR